MDSHPINIFTQSEKDNALLTQTELGNFNQVLELIRMLANPNTQDKQGRTPLLFACEGGHTEIAQLLIQNGANVNIADKFEKITPLMLACLNGHRGIVQLLLENHANVNAADNFGSTSLIISSGFANIEIIKLLIQKGAEINATETNGCTALMAAVINGLTEVAQLLIEAGAHVTVSTFNKSETALFFALNREDDLGKQLAFILLNNMSESEKLIALKHSPSLKNIIENFNQIISDYRPNMFNIFSPILFNKKIDPPHSFEVRAKQVSIQITRENKKLKEEGNERVELKEDHKKRKLKP